MRSFYFGDYARVRQMAAVTFDSIQVLRALAANIVLLAHLSVIELKYGQGIAVLPDWVGLGGAAGVNLFFVISGFVMALVSRKTGWRDFIAARMIRIYPIYWFYTSLVLVIFLLRPDIVNQSFAHPALIWKSYLLWPEDVYPLLAVGWTLIHEMYFYLVMTTIIACTVPLSIALPVWALVVLAMSFVVTSSSSPVMAVIGHPMTLEFIAGAAVGLILPKLRTRWGTLAVLLGIAMLAAGFVLYGCGPAVTDDRWARVVYLGMPFIPIVYGVAAIERSGHWRPIAWLSRLGDASYSTYLSHVLTISVLGRLFAIQPVHNVYSQVAFLTGCVIVANGVGLLSFDYLERPALIGFRRRLRALVGDDFAVVRK